MHNTTHACTFVDMKGIGLRITQAREAARLNQSELARQMGVSPQAVQKWEACETVPRGQRIERLADALGVSVGHLVTGDESTLHDLEGQPPIAGTVVIPRLDVSGSMGAGLPRHQWFTDVVERMTVSTEWIRRSLSVSSPDSLAIITGRGDSMEGTFSDGDLLLVDRGITDLRIDGLFVMAIDDDLYIKRVQRQPGGVIMLISDNPKYQPIMLRREDMVSFSVLARVLLVWNAHRL